MDLAVPDAVGTPTGPWEPLTHNANNEATGGIWRVPGARRHAVLKLATPPPAGSGGGTWSTSDEPTHWNYWRRESLAYRTGLAARCYADAGIGVPELIAADDRADGSVALWLGAVEGTPGPEWTVERLADLGHRLGVGQARWVDAVPAQPWLSRDWLTRYLGARRVPDRPDWDDDRIAAHWPAALRARLAALWGDRREVLRRATAGPRTLCHLDVWPMNLVGTAAGPVLLDWAFVGAGALGEDAANLIVDCVTDGLIDAALLPEIAAGVADGYVTGLRDGGWRGSAEAVRRSIAATGAAKYCWFAPALVDRVTSGGRVGSPHYDAATSADAVLARVADLLWMLADWAAGEARAG